MKYFSLLLLAITLTSCLEGDDDSFQTTSSVLFMNVYNDAASGIDIQVNGSSWRNGFRAYGEPGGYSSFYSGEITFAAYPKGTSEGNALASVTQALGPDSKYTCFVTGRLGEAKMILLPDTMRSPAANKALIRLVNLSPDLSKADIGIADSGTVIRNLDYLSTAYMTLDTGLNVINAYRVGVTQPLASFRFRAASRGVYTMYIKGLQGREGKDSLAVGNYIQP